ncbi:3-hydroxyacyl-CoA dehydrogenase/enoyl-CoA hydratase family protein [Alkalihalobacillus trypoxylicola]|uniref:3-hydroxyacyl-CoA dehydrogenase n=1 Tax=Alkalihalobacillus trypoxylicola TaxID=519424 RepID=A0A161Q8T8_9BACI|nr:3-hydroxyacyl-CoA dehydrogenase/enoyl-CoA hydratase family protein [Alkalihalobacillus trypoxylicola]KYG33575.1 3-hydroxyacyl-CoA dehydrogenase [Alkalihalobacillus trypoxylicola]
MDIQINRAAVIGAGVMGSQIAALLANAGIITYLFELAPTKRTEHEKNLGLTLNSEIVRNRLSLKAIENLKKQKPAPLGSLESVNYIQACNLESDLSKLSEVDWIIEAVVEKLEVKKELLKKIEGLKKTSCVVSSNTSGLSIEQMVADCSDSFKERFLGIHFFNPPRYLKLVEMIPNTKTSKSMIENMRAFSEERLGKTVVIAKDSPNFIANRIGTFGLLLTVKEMLEKGLTIQEVDQLTGPLIGRPKSATFRTLDVVGIDTFAFVSDTLFSQLDEQEKELFKLPRFMEELIHSGAIGQKAGKGFYQKVKTEYKSEILSLNPQTMTYEKAEKQTTPLINKAKQIRNLKERLEFIFEQNEEQAQFLWTVIARVLLYAADKKEEIAENLYSIDTAMKAGFGWEAGPFEIWEMLGLEKTLDKMKESEFQIPNWIEEMVSLNHKHFYQDNQYYEPQSNTYMEIASQSDCYRTSLLSNNKKIIGNTGASLIEIEDDVAFLQLHSQNQAIGLDVIDMIQKSVKEVETNYKGLVISHSGKNFCVGANLLMILLEAQSENYDEIDHIIQLFQRSMSQIRYSKRPIVVGVFGMNLGGGVEMSLPAASIQASFETYMGLVETGVGIIPGGGGNKELYLRHLPSKKSLTSIDIQNAANQTFEKIALAKVSTSALEAKELHYLGEQDDVIMNRDEMIETSKQKAIRLWNQGYQPPLKKGIPVAGESGYATMLVGASMLHKAGKISDHDLKIAKKLAFVIAGGRVPKGSVVDEEYLLDIEREAFLSLVGEPKTQQRMQHMLLKKKPLRN